MLTPEQEKWIAHLPGNNKIEIRPYDPSAKSKFAALEKKIKTILGSNQKVEHRGATSLGISGYGEIDVFIPVALKIFDQTLTKLKTAFGEPGSVYRPERARFVTYVQETKAEIILINKNGKNWNESLKFEGYLKSHPEALKSYEALKESCSGLSTREYYRQKNIFINSILAKCLS
jgi:GrpB-like predicted nucleotidyltransferase (UPF0157 family)